MDVSANGQRVRFTREVADLLAAARLQAVENRRCWSAALALRLRGARADDGNSQRPPD